MEFQDVRVPPQRIMHAVYLGETETVCGVLYDNEEFPDKTARIFPNF